MKISSVALGIVLASASFYANANDDFDRTIDRIGMQFNTPFVVFKEGLSAPCGAVSLGSFDQAQTRAMYAALLSARAGDNRVYHIGYTQNGDGTCVATSLELRS